MQRSDLEARTRQYISEQFGLLVSCAPDTVSINLGRFSAVVDFAACLGLVGYKERNRLMESAAIAVENRRGVFHEIH